MSMMIPTRSEGLRRLAAFIPHSGADYARLRNLDLPGHPHVSRLSPWIRHRLVTEAEVIEAALKQHGGSAEKFLSEVLWRSYWKGWLELRPGIWGAYRQGLQGALNRMATEPGLAARAEAAMLGETGVDGFDDWSRELVTTGYMHNHARMWFASIWVFTLHLPWELGADFFMRHLIDGDPASNTLSWRWVAGLHTPGKTYLATADNIARNTYGRYRPEGLAPVAPAPRMPQLPEPKSSPVADTPRPGMRSLLLVTEEDLSPAHLMTPDLNLRAVAVLTDVGGRSPLAVSSLVYRFTEGAIADTLDRLGAGDAPIFAGNDLVSLVDFAVNQGVDQIITAYAPTGPVAERLQHLSTLATARGVNLVRCLRDHDRAMWPHATHGFFRFRETVKF
jgi:deoxyribodipyrimidine photo-lyase